MQKRTANLQLAKRTSVSSHLCMMIQWTEDADRIGGLEIEACIIETRATVGYTLSNTFNSQ